MAGFPNLTLMAEMFENTAERLRANAALVRTLEEPAAKQKKKRRKQSQVCPLLELPNDVLVLVARALLFDDPQVDSQAVCRLVTSSKALQQLVRGDETVMKELKAAREMLTQLRLHELNVVVALEPKGAAPPFVPTNYKEFVLQPPTPVTKLVLIDAEWRIGFGLDDGAARGRAVARVLRVSASLRNLDLPQNDLGDAGVKEIAKALVVNRSLKRLNLFGNYVGDAGAKRIAKALKINNVLKNLELWGNDAIGEMGAEKLAKAMRCNTRLRYLAVDASIKRHASLRQCNGSACKDRWCWLHGLSRKEGKRIHASNLLLAGLLKCVRRLRRARLESLANEFGIAEN